MKVLLIGVGRQGKTALYDLVHGEDVSEVVAADINLTGSSPTLAASHMLAGYAASKSIPTVQKAWIA